MLPLVLGAAEPIETLKSYASLYLREEVQAEGLVRNVGNFAQERYEIPPPATRHGFAPPFTSGQS